MRLHRFFIEQPIGVEESGSNNLVLTHEPLLHQWKRVFRYKPGDKVLLFDNSGYEFEAEIEYLEPKEARLRITEARDKKETGTRTMVHLCASLTKKDTFEWMLEKVTELGVMEVTPLLSERSEKKGLNFERAQRILIEASEQSGRVIVPNLREIAKLSDILSAMRGTTIAFDPSGETFSPEKISNLNTSQSLNVFVGPEGGWSPAELELFTTHNIPVYSLGARGTQQILRAETASIAIAALLLLR